MHIWKTIANEDKQTQQCCLVWGFSPRFEEFMLVMGHFSLGVNFSLRDRCKNHPSLVGIGNVVALTSPLQPGLPILWASEITPTCSLWFADSFILSWRIRLN